MKERRVKISRESGIGDVPYVAWKDLISALIMAGYDVSADERSIYFGLGTEDKVVEEKDGLSQEI